MQATKIVCLGDSLTEGYAIDLSYRWSTFLKKKMKLDIVNSGISGDTTAGMLGRFQSDVLAHQPSHLILMGGTNDLSFNVPNELIISNLHAMTRQARHHDIATIIGIPTPFFTETATYPSAQLLQKQIANFRQALMTYCIEDERAYIDFGANMSVDLFLADGLHPSEQGHEVMAENAQAVLEGIL